MEITERDAIVKWDFQEPGARLRPWLRELNIWRHDTSTPLQEARSQTVTSRSPSVRLVEVWQINSVRSKFCSEWRLSQKYRFKWHCIKRRETPKGTFVEFTSRISNRMCEMESRSQRVSPAKDEGLHHKATGQVDT